MERWKIAIEKGDLISRISALVQKRNAAIFFGNAHPLNGGKAPAADIPISMDLGRDFR
jgi:hypothetical protein